MLLLLLNFLYSCKKIIPKKKVECNSENGFYCRKRFYIGANNGENILPGAVLRLCAFLRTKITSVPRGKAVRAVT